MSAPRHLSVVSTDRLPGRPPSGLEPLGQDCILAEALGVRHGGRIDPRD